MTRTLRGRSISYGVIVRVNFSFRQGEVIALMGANGSGKSTLARIMAGLIVPMAGELQLLQDEMVKSWAEVKRWQEIGLIGQHPRRQTIGATVAEELGFGLLNFGYEIKKVQDRVKEIAWEMGLEEKLNQSPASLSGGERQRLVLAAVLALNPSFLLLDEALSMLDERTQEACLEQLKGKGRNMGQLWITHDPQLAAKADRLWVMKEGKLIEGGKPKEVLRDEEFCGKYLIRPICCAHESGHSSGEGIWDRYDRVQSVRGAGHIHGNMQPVIPYILQWQKAAYGNRLKLSEGVREKTFLAVLGPSGAGKSTFLEGAIALLKPTEGRFLAFGEEVRQDGGLRQRVRLMIQEPGEYMIGSTIYNEVFYLQTHKEKKKKSQLNLEYLQVFGISGELAPAYVEDLSGGERQKVALAAALESLPEVLMLDEPLLGLDAAGWGLIRELLREMKGRLTIIYVTHDWSEVRDLADEVWLIEGGQVAFKCQGREVDQNKERFKEAGIRC